MTRLLVTGAGGRIGRRLRRLVEDIDAAFVTSPRALARDPGDIVGDVTDRDRMAAIVEEHQPEAIIHLASVTATECDADPVRARAVNVDAVRRLAESAVANGVQRFVLASTSAVYGDRYDTPATETAELVLGSAYAKTKREAELALAEVANLDSRFSAVSLRIFNVYGPGMTESLPNRLLDATDERPVTLFGLDDFVRDHVHVDDVGTALLLAAERPMPTPWTVINIGSGRPTSNRDLVDAIGPVAYALGDPRRSYSCADLATASELLAYAPTRTLSRESLVEQG
jgi:UDP-glucose 4-epimerase